MIQLYGEIGCNRCEMAKELLANKGVEFEYFIMSTDLSDEKYKEIMGIAKEANEINLPLIIENNTIKQLKEVI